MNSISRVEHWGKFTFILDKYDEREYSSESRHVWLGIIKQAISDYIEFKYSCDSKERELYYCARDFLFDDEYTIYFGTKDITLAEIIDILGGNIERVRKDICKLEEEVNSDKGYEKGTQLPLF